MSSLFQESQLTDIVVNANPKNIPYSLLAITNYWKNSINLVLKIYTHSSVAELPLAAKQFEEKVAATRLECNETKLPSLKVSLIWKNVPNTELITATCNNISILGEVNILRYLNRIGKLELSYEHADSVTCNTVDNVLDVCHQLYAATKDAKSRQTYWKLLAQLLGNNKRFGDGEQLAMSDLAVGCVVRQFIENDKIPDSLKGVHQFAQQILQY